MCKSLLYSVLLVFIGLIGSNRTLAQQDEVKSGSRTLDISERVAADLYHNALSQINHYDRFLADDKSEIDRIVSLLHTRYPELAYEIESSPQSLANQPEISQLIVSIVKEETIEGLSAINEGLSQSLSKTALDPHSLRTLEFLYAYELFRAKRLNEADKIWQRLIKSRKGEYEYAAYYAGLTALLQGRNNDAVLLLSKVGKTDRLKYHTPYYLAAAHYAQEEYTDVLKYYSLRIDETQLHNIEDLIKIVAYAQYKEEHYSDCVKSLNKLDLYVDLSSEESFVLGMALSKSGQLEASHDLLSAVIQQDGDVQVNAAYEYALQLSQQGKHQESLLAFEKMVNDSQYDQSKVTYNLALLSAKLGKYDMAAHHALRLGSSKYNQKADFILLQILDNLENENLYRQVALILKSKPNTHQKLKTSLYNKGVIALQQQNFTLANDFFELLGDVDPLIEERGAVAAWKGIMAFQNKEYKKSTKLLTNYLRSKSVSDQHNKLEFDANYFLAYGHFKLHQHKRALGYFSEALKISNQSTNTLASNKKNILEDLSLRIADNYFLLGNYKEAIASYRRVDEINGTHRAYALWQQAVISELQNDPYDQILILDDLISTHPKSKYYYKALFSSANTLFGLNKYDKAAQFYKKILNNNIPQDMKEESIVQLGLIAVNAGEYDRAAKYYNQIINTTENTEMKHRAHLALKEIYSDYTYDTDAYLAVVATTTENEDSKPLDSVLYNLAVNTLESGKNAKAIEQWKKLISDYPDSDLIDDAWMRIGQSETTNKEWNKAIDSYNQVVALSSPEFQNTAQDMALEIAFAKLKDYNLYLELRNRYQVPTTASRAYNDAIAYLNTSKPIQSAKLLPTIYKGSEVNVKNKRDLLNNISQELMKSQEWKSLASIGSTDIMINEIDASPKHIYYRALAFMNLRELEEASLAITEHYATLLEDPAWLAKSIILLSDIYILQGDTDNAETALQALVETESQVPPSLIKVAKNRLENLVHVAN